MNKKGMTLVTLAIVIVLMIIIAGVVIINLNNTDVISKAQGAVEQYNLKNTEQYANMAYYNVYFDNLKNGIRRTVTVQELKQRMIQDGFSSSELEKYNIVIENGEIKISIKN